jgi:hypothetical protein
MFQRGRRRRFGLHLGISLFENDICFRLNPRIQSRRDSPAQSRESQGVFPFEYGICQSESRHQISPSHPPNRILGPPHQSTAINLSPRTDFSITAAIHIICPHLERWYTTSSIIKSPCHYPALLILNISKPSSLFLSPYLYHQTSSSISQTTTRSHQIHPALTSSTIIRAMHAKNQPSIPHATP